MGIRVLFLAFVLGMLGLSAYADDPAAGSAVPLGQAISPEDAQALRRDLGALAQAMDGEEAPAQPGYADAPSYAAAPTAAPPAAVPTKTTADVADRALTMVNKLIVSVSESMEKVAPEVWRVMIRQQYAKAIGDLVVPLGLFLASIGYWFAMRTPRKNVEMKETAEASFRTSNNPPVDALWYYCTAWAFPMAGMLICGTWTLVCLSDSIKLLLNPEFYAVRDLIILLLQPASLQ